MRDEGVVVLRGCFAPDAVLRFREAAERCFGAIESGQPISGRYRYVSQAHSVQLGALLDFGIEGKEALVAPLSVPGVCESLSELIGGPWQCGLEHAWVRKKFAPKDARGRDYIQDWHQDGALGVQFPQPGLPIAMTHLATCWIPLNDCGTDSPGLEFIRTSPGGLVHFSELNDAALRRRFREGAFWAPRLALGDALVFRNDVLHRTHVNSTMAWDRISIEYRVFPTQL